MNQTSNQPVWVLVLAGVILLCSLAKYFAPTVPLSTWKYYKIIGYTGKVSGKLDKMFRLPAVDKHPIQGGY